MNPAPVSVIVPVHPAASPFVAEAVRSAVTQAPAPAELILVGEGIDAVAAADVRGWGGDLVVVPLAGANSSTALNAGIARARHDHYAFLDADDIWLPGKLERQLAEFESDPGVDMLWGLIQQFLDPGADPELARRLIIPPGTLTGAHKSTLVIRRAAFDRVGPFDESQGPTDFVDWLLRAREAGLTERVIDQLMLRRRIHGTNTGLTQGDTMRAESLDVLKASLDRRRAGV